MAHRILAGLALAVALAPTAAHAAQTLDQSFDPPPFLTFTFGTDVALAQTFTVGVTGILTQVDVRIGTSNSDGTLSDLLFDIRPTVGGIPVADDTAALVTETIPSTRLVPDTVAFIPIDLRAHQLPVTAGDVLAIVLRAPGATGQPYACQGAAFDGYPRGTGFFRRDFFPNWTFLGDLAFRTFVGEPGLPPEVVINIRPGTFPNRVNVRSQGVIPVAILTSDTFDAATVDVATVRFGPDGAFEAHGRGHAEDVDGDGRTDLVLHFEVAQTGIRCGDTTATLTGETSTGEQFAAADTIVVRECP